MIKLFIEYEDGGKLTVTCKKRTVASAYEKYGKRLSAKRVVMQEYPKKNHEPVLLRGDWNE